MLAPCIVNGHAFVVCHSRLGSVKKTGPVTGNGYDIGQYGVWINEEDAEILVEELDTIWCFKSQGFIEIHSVVYLDPTREQIASIGG